MQESDKEADRWWQWGRLTAGTSKEEVSGKPDGEHVFHRHTERMQDSLPWNEICSKEEPGGGKEAGNNEIKPGDGSELGVCPWWRYQGHS